MMGALLKELFRALRRYFRYHLARIFGLPAPVVPQAPLAGIAKPEQIARLSNAVGLDASYLKSVRWQADRGTVRVNGR